MTTELRERTIADFGEQWSVYTDNSGYYGSRALLEDVLGPLLDVSALQGLVAADIGAGTGRFTNILLQCGVRRVIAVEPSDAYNALVRNTAHWGERVERVRAGGEDFRPASSVDFAFSYGVLHHIPDPDPVVGAVFDALRPGGRFCAWVYGRENNAAYVWLLTVVSAMTTRLPHAALAALVWLSYWPLVAYMHLCGWFDLPVASHTRAAPP